MSDLKHKFLKYFGKKNSMYFAKKNLALFSWKDYLQQKWQLSLKVCAPIFRYIFVRKIRNEACPPFMTYKSITVRAAQQWPIQKSILSVQNTNDKRSLLYLKKNPQKTKKIGTNSKPHFNIHQKRNCSLEDVGKTMYVQHT